MNLKAYSPFFAEARQTKWTALLFILGVELATSLFIINVLWEGQPQTYIYYLFVATHGYVQATMIGSLFSLVVILPLVFGLGRLRPEDIGWRPQNIIPGIIFTFCFWVGVHVTMAAVIVLSGEKIGWNPDWSQNSPGIVIGKFLAQFLGNALQEETVMRGFLLPQLYLIARKKLPSWKALVAALLISQAIFALSHIPHRIFEMRLSGLAVFADQPYLFLDGVILAIVYLLTRNLFVAVGIHSLMNFPTLLIRIPNASVVVSYLLCLPLLILSILIYRIVFRDTFKPSLAMRQAPPEDAIPANTGSGVNG